MTSTSRRTVLTALATAAVSGPLLGSLTATDAHATGDLDIFTSNTDLYRKLAGQEGVEFARRYRRHEYADHSLPQGYPYNRTTVMALPGGGIETGTSELCLAGRDHRVRGPGPRTAREHHVRVCSRACIFVQL